jgi:hypothetical protein
MADDFVSKSLASAKKALSDANNSKVSPAKSPYAPPPPKTEHSDADYSMAHAASKAPSTGDELKAKSDNVEQYAKSQ